VAVHNELGKLGEKIAIGYLSERSYEILERNWRIGRLEVDIIARTGNKLVIAEVKTRAENPTLLPEEAVNIKRQKRLIRAANAYIGRTNLNLDVRFDIITVIFETKTGYRLNHIENAFYPMVRSQGNGY
jgi:putative endonuclease